MIYEATYYQVICDDPQCLAESQQSSTETHAKACARQDGFVEVDGKWFCESHAPKPKKAKARR